MLRVFYSHGLSMLELGSFELLTAGTERFVSRSFSAFFLSTLATYMTTAARNGPRVSREWQTSSLADGAKMPLCMRLVRQLRSAWIRGFPLVPLGSTNSLAVPPAAAFDAGRGGGDGLPRASGVSGTGVSPSKTEPVVSAPSASAEGLTPR